jgi:hypothetical protein
VKETERGWLETPETLATAVAPSTAMAFVLAVTATPPVPVSTTVVVV